MFFNITYLWILWSYDRPPFKVFPRKFRFELFNERWIFRNFILTPHTLKTFLRKGNIWSWSKLLQSAVSHIFFRWARHTHWRNTLGIVSTKNGQGSGFGYWSFFCFHRDMQFWRLSQQDSAVEDERKTYQSGVFKNPVALTVVIVSSFLLGVLGKPSFSTLLGTTLSTLNVWGWE